MTSSTIQEIRNCNFNVQGSYTNTVTNNLNIIQMTHSYFQRGLKVSSASGTCSQPERISDMLLRAERLQRSTTMLSEELRLTTRSPVEYRDLIEVLDKISGETIPNIFRFCVNHTQLGKQHEQRLLVEIVYMQGLLEDFSKKRARDRDLKLEAPTEEQNSRRQWRLTLKAFMELLWCSFWWLFYAKYIVKIIRKALLDSQARINVALFERLICSVDNGVPSHHIQIDDFFGAEWFLPQDLCLNRQAFFSVLRFKFQGGPAESVITSQRFTVFRQADLQAVQAPDWEKVIEEGEGLRLSVLINQLCNEAADDPKALHCPQYYPNYSLRCNKNWNLSLLDLGNDNWSGSKEHTLSDFKALPRGDGNQLDYGFTFRYFSIRIVAKEQPHEGVSSRFTEYEGDNESGIHEHRQLNEERGQVPASAEKTPRRWFSTSSKEKSKKGLNPNAKVFSFNRKSPSGSYDVLNPNGLGAHYIPSSNSFFSRVFAPSPAEREALQRALGGSTNPSLECLPSLSEVGSMPSSPTLGHAGPALPHVPQHAGRDMSKVLPSWLQSLPMMRKPATAFNPWDDEDEASSGVVYTV